MTATPHPPRVLSLIPPSHVATVFRPETWQLLRDATDLIENTNTHHQSPDEVAAQLGDSDVVVTGWGASPFSRHHLEAAPRLKLVVHTAGSVKRLFPGDLATRVLLPRGIRVVSGYEAIAINVAEATIGLMIASSRRWPQLAAAYRSTRRKDVPHPTNGRFLTGATVGLVSASKVARQVIRLLIPFSCQVLVYDPFLSPEEADALNVTRVALDELFARSDIVSVHAPALPSTRNLIGRDQLRMLRDGATFINTARGMLVDHPAMLEEARRGRIQIALDVTEPEPLPPDAELWDLPNVLLLPHVAGMGHAGLFRIGDISLAAILDDPAVRPVEGVVPLERWETLA